ncbi:MAG: chorismate synthase [Bacteroidetes bacterium]|nr:MAG: chorismate synthase [Bacteroidota bacterium]REJ99929.1 MAG: chorismate synthase [Bacteroidota bacterium]REK35891.1 MAG: chorismate synthase [Bacteroidota bacterium]REK50632.1 MAG: chorismate synthase [Bacteroidota bacterium]
MAGNIFGNVLRLMTFGESHGPGTGGILEGCPSGMTLDLDLIRNEMQRRKPGQSGISSPRKEDDEFEILSGVFEGNTLGTPIGFLIRNKDARSGDYEATKELYRPSHADFTYEEKYGLRDYRGGGRSSARETASRVFAGAIAKQILMKHGIAVNACVTQAGKIKLQIPPENLEFSLAENNVVRCPDAQTAGQMIAYIEKLREEGDTCGGVITCLISNAPAGLGEPVFDKLQAELAKACMSIPAAHGFEYGSGFAGAEMKGSAHNDAFIKVENGRIRTATNFSGGIQGGISNGMNIYFRVAFKPVSTIKTNQKTVNHAGEEVVLKAEGRHDPCVLPRAVPVVEAMSALVIADFLLRNSFVKFD